MALGENIKKRRKELKLSQEYVAEQLGVSRQAVSKWETGQSEPTASNLIQLADLFEIRLSELVNPNKEETERSTLEKTQGGKKPNLILQANLTRIAISAQVVFLYNCVWMISEIRRADFVVQNLYRRAFVFFLVLLALSSIWMAINHRYETNKKQRCKNVYIELAYCCVQMLVSFLTIRFGMGLVGAVIMIAIGCIYIIYINPKFMCRKLTR